MVILITFILSANSLGKDNVFQNEIMIINI